MEILWFLTGSGIVAAVLYGVLRNGGSGQVDMTPLLEAIAALQQQAAPENGQAETPVRLGDILERLESLETRFERLHQDSLRYLQQGAQRHKRAEQLLEDQQSADEMDGPPETAQPVLPFPEQEEQTDMAWAADQIRKRGETPLS